MFFALKYNKLIEEHNSKAIQSGFHYDNHAAEEQKYFSSALDNLALADFSEKYFIT